ncbi:MAG: YggS family pyridoxal phosphate-dependent enzyme, partial [Peptostreptococcaceae bacterium]|nr:YggS family pyridoxal phosphate-dependent enzyme [Peptostreptococcaceae bacterium]
MNYISKNIDYIKSEIINSCKKVNRENEANLIAVTKTVDIDVINEAIESGITDVGENKPQELARKYDVIGDKVRWHQIGSLQTNKVKYIIDKVYMIHSIDRL